MQAMQATDRHAARRGRARRILVRMFHSELGDAHDASPKLKPKPKRGRLLKNATEATSADAFSRRESAFFGPELMLLFAVACAFAVSVSFAAVVFVSAWNGPDCRSPRRSILIGNVVLVAGCSQKSSRFGSGP
jgi:hypothetical protein